MIWRCFRFVEKRLIVELDGGQHEEETDARRTSFLEAQGYRIIHFWNNDVNESFAGVLSAIVSALKS